MNYFHYFPKEILNGSSINWYFESTKKKGGEKKNTNFLFTKKYLKISRDKNQYLFFDNQHFILGLYQRHVQQLVIIIYCDKHLL